MFTHKYTVIPLSVTAIGLVLVVTAIVSVHNGDLLTALGFALLAFVCDVLDGAVARYLHAESYVGRVADSVVDVVLYLLFPAYILLVTNSLDEVFGPYLILSLMVFVGSGVFRLVRFTRRGFVATDGGLAYEGVPVFVTLPMVAAFVFLITLGVVPSPYVVIGVLLVLSGAMVSTYSVPKLTHVPSIGALVITALALGTMLIWIG